MSSIYIAVGRVGSDIDKGTTSNGNSYANWSMAIRQNAKQEEPDWFNCVAYKNLADIIGKYVKKGDLLHITKAYPRNRKWTDKEGNNRVSTEFIINDIELMPNKKSSEAQPSESFTTNSTWKNNSNKSADNKEDDVMPFDL